MTSVLPRPLGREQHLRGPGSRKHTGRSRQNYGLLVVATYSLVLALSLLVGVEAELAPEQMRSLAAAVTGLVAGGFLVRQAESPSPVIMDSYVVATMLLLPLLLGVVLVTLTSLPTSAVTGIRAKPGVVRAVVLDAALAVSIGAVLNMLMGGPLMVQGAMEERSPVLYPLLAVFAIASLASVVRSLANRGLARQAAQPGQILPSPLEYGRTLAVAGSTGLAAVTWAVVSVISGYSLSWAVVCAALGLLCIPLVLISSHMRRTEQQGSKAVIAELEGRLHQLVAERDASTARLRRAVHSGPLQTINASAMLASLQAGSGQEDSEIWNEQYEVLRRIDEELRGALRRSGVEEFGESLPVIVSQLPQVALRRLGNSILWDIDEGGWEAMSPEARKAVAEVVTQVLLHHAADGAVRVAVTLLAGSNHATTLIAVACREQARVWNGTLTQRVRIEGLNGTLSSERTDNGLVVTAIVMPAHT